MKQQIVAVCLVFSMVLLVPVSLLADTKPHTDSERIELLEKENRELRKRLEILEEKLGAEPYVDKESIPETTQTFLGSTEVSGFVSASYFYNFNKPESKLNTGRGFDNAHNEFMLNKAYLALEKPVEYGAIEWNAGYKVALLFGQDAEFTQSEGLSLGDNGDLFEAYLVVNAPIGNGVKVTFGKYGTVHGYEYNETELNYNWSGGLLWTFAQPFTHTGLKLGYQWTQQLETEILIMNGWDVVRDTNNSFSYMGAIYYTTADEKTSFTLIGFGGPEQEDNNSDWQKGVQFIVEHQVTPEWTAAVELDYGHEDAGDANGQSAEWFGAGIWLIHEPSEKWNVAMRGEWLKDSDAWLTTDSSVFPTFFDLSTRGHELVSVTLTVNIKPVPELRIAPEIRWDRSSDSDAFDGHDSQVTAGIGAAYFF